MPTYGMGNAMREVRMRLGYTQEELAYGICTVGTLSKIENGRAVISKQVFEALCSRLPGLHHVWVSCDTEKEMQRSRLCKQILVYLEFRKLPAAKTAMECYSRIKDEKSPFCRQFEWYTKAVYQAAAKEEEDKILPNLKRALKVTMPSYEARFRQHKKGMMLTYDEVYILSNMGIAYARQNEMENAFRILYFLKEYFVKQNLDMVESMKVCPMVFGNLAWLFHKQGRFKEAVKLCDSGIEICLSSGRYTVLPHLLCIKAHGLTASGSPVTAQKSRRQAEALLGISEEYRGYGCFLDFYKAMEPIFVTF